MSGTKISSQSDQLQSTLLELKNAQEKIEQLTDQLQLANDENIKLKDKFSKNSKNSSKPSSTDGFNKPAPKSLRGKSGKLVGGQLGHKGTTLRMIENPDKIIPHTPHACDQCQEALTEDAFIHDRRQVIDLVDKIKVTIEHRAESKMCGKCGSTTKASFPDHVNARIQYGPGVKAVATYLNKRQLIPYARTAETLSDLFNIKPSPGTLVNMIKGTSEKLKDIDAIIKAKVQKSPVVHFDESGMKVEGKGHWLHVAVTNILSYFHIHEGRGTEAIDDMGILPDFTGFSIHDHWKPYFKYTNSTHYLCNAHHLRELEFIRERYKYPWAENMQKLLREIKKEVDGVKDKGDIAISKDTREAFTKRYFEIIEQGYVEDPPVIADPTQKKKPGPVAQSKGRNLLDRLRDFNEAVLGFMNNFLVPFDNNQAERDIRMIKVQQKISGTFRSVDGPTHYCRIMSYMSTIRKNSINVIDALASVFSGTPLLPSIFNST
jgi:transposase